jgi:hypothetical protein
MTKTKFTKLSKSGSREFPNFPSENLAKFGHKNHESKIN